MDKEGMRSTPYVWTSTMDALSHQHGGKPDIPHTHTHVRLNRRNPFRTAHHISARSAQQLKRSGVCGVCAYKLQDATAALVEEGATPRPANP